MSTYINLINREDVLTLLSVEDHLPWDQRSEVLVRLKRVVDELPMVLAAPNQERYLHAKKEERRWDNMRQLIASGVLADRANKQAHLDRDLEEHAVLDPEDWG